jgi:Spy/CpxP family protein refolding chaperone
VTRALIAIVGLTVVLGHATEAVGQAPATVPNDRAAAQDRIRERVVRLLRERVGLSDDQFRRLAPVSQSFEARRQTIFREERATRHALRRELSTGSADQTQVAAHIDQLFVLQRRRLDLAAEEQRELAAFMTPVQRARYLGLQEHLRRRAEEMRRRRGDGPPRGGGRRAPPGGAPRFE